jgi:hypothetical protein
LRSIELCHNAKLKIWKIWKIWKISTAKAQGTAVASRPLVPALPQWRSGGCCGNDLAAFQKNELNEPVEDMEEQSRMERNGKEWKGNS